MRESLSPHSSPTFCVKKATRGWRIVHAFNKLNNSTIPAQTYIHRKDMVLNHMSKSDGTGVSSHLRQQFVCESKEVCLFCTGTSGTGLFRE